MSCKQQNIRCYQEVREKSRAFHIISKHGREREREKEREIEREREREREREKERERQTDRQTDRQSTCKTNRREVWCDFHMQNLKHLCYEIPNFTFNDK